MWITCLILKMKGANVSALWQIKFPLGCSASRTLPSVCPALLPARAWSSSRCWHQLQALSCRQLCLKVNAQPQGARRNIFLYLPALLPAPIPNSSLPVTNSCSVQRVRQPRQCRVLVPSHLFPGLKGVQSTAVSDV